MKYRSKKLYTKSFNKQKESNSDEDEIIKWLRKFGPASRTDLAYAFGFSRAKITPLVSDLIHRGIIREGGNVDTNEGRPPRLIRFEEDFGYVIGVDLGATSVDVGLADFSGRIVSCFGEPLALCSSPEIILKRICEIINDLVQKEKIGKECIIAIGLGVPGPVDFSTKLLVSPCGLPGWEVFPIREYMKQQFPQAEIFIDNDANIMAFGELRAGIGKGVDNFIFLKVGTGIGAGIVCNGEIYQGSSGCSGDVGHICVDREGPVCVCGNRGCLQSLASGKAIAEKAAQGALEGKSPLLSERMSSKENQLTAEDVSMAAAAGDAFSNKLLQESGELIGETLAGVVNVLNPSHLLIGGGVSNIGHQFLSSIRRAILRRSHPLSTRDLRIEYSSLGMKAGIIGAVSLALELFQMERRD
jgi:glucokinase-like ROK family protein